MLMSRQAPYLLGLSEEEHAAALGRLRARVEQVGLVQYRGYFERLAPCWPSHPEAVIELSTARAGNLTKLEAPQEPARQVGV